MGGLSGLPLVTILSMMDEQIMIHGQDMIKRGMVRRKPMTGRSGTAAQSVGMGKHNGMARENIKRNTTMMEAQSMIRNRLMAMVSPQR